MSLFLIVYLLIYGTAHGYLFWKLHQGTGPMGRWAVLPAAFMALMVLGPIAVRVLDRSGHFRLAGVGSLVTHVWMALAFWLVCLFLLGDAWNLLARLAALEWPGAGRALLRPRTALAAFAAITALLAVWGVVAAGRIRPREVVIRVRELPAGSRPIVIAQLTDLHLGIDTGRRRLGRILDVVRQVKPDLLVSTGDLVDSPKQRLDGLAGMLRTVDAPLGKFAVLGNHEFYSGLSDSLAFHREAGFRLLRQEHVSAAPGLRLAGVDDPAGRFVEGGAGPEEARALPEQGSFVVLLKHRPSVEDASLGRFDLQLSGHTHGGQIFPFALIVNMIYRHGPGLHELGRDSRLFVSRGAGTWGPPMRVGAPPEVTVIRLVPEE